jgi:transcriptional regulator with XRE-family HTH domain
MSGAQLRVVRQSLDLTQQRAAKQWGLSQAYLSLMEHDRRRVPRRLVALLARRMPPLATELPLESLGARASDSERLLGELGYPGYSYLAKGRKLANPALLVLSVLAMPAAPARVLEALPWLLVHYVDLNWDWLLTRVKAANLQNRLGYLVALARQVAESQNHADATEKLANVARQLDEARLVKEDTLGRELTEAERRYLRDHRSETAAHWNLLTSLRADQLPHVV